MMRLLRSLSFRLALVYAALFVSSTGLLVSVYYWISIRQPLEAIRAEVSREAAMLADVYILDGRGPLIERLEARASRHGPRSVFHAYIDPAGDIVASNLPSLPPPSRERRRWIRIEADFYLLGDEDEHEALSIDRRFDDGARLIVGRDIEEVDNRGDALSSAIPPFIGIALLLTVVGSALMSLAIGRRLEAITTTARQVIGGDLSGRIPMLGTGDDFDQLNETLNEMLARIEKLVESVRRVSDSVAHELRTPLARLRADLDELAVAEGDEAGRLRAQAVGEAERLEAVFDALLRIARIESGRHEAGMREVDLSALLADAIEFYRPAAEDRALAYAAAIEEGIAVRGDPDLIFQTVCNLLDNAIKYTPAGGRVALEAARDDGAAIVTVNDTGPGIAETDRARIGERFYRAPETADRPGFGLGLGLAFAVAALHHSTLTLANRDPGLSARWRLPALPRA